MRTIRIDVQYDGTDFRGFAPQPNTRTVGGELESVLQRVLGGRMRVTPAGRTDTGVHAHGQVVSFRTDSAMPCAELKRAVNALVGQDVLVQDVSDAPDDFDARRSVRSRCYGYAIWNGPERNIFERRWTSHVDEPLDVDAMHEACQALVGRHDFAAFRTHRTQDDPGKGTIRRVHAAAWWRDTMCPTIVRFEIEADAFLRHMVRTIVGTSILVGLGKAPTGRIAATMERGERAGAGRTAPAQGLTLLRVTY
jgi:tRNA pseudouridine38-40 synthase